MTKTKKLTLSAMFTTLGLILPLLTGQVKEIGNMLLPMHIPVILCGIICGGSWGFVTGLILPFLRSLIFGVPTMMPTAVSMSFELSVYGAVSGILYNHIFHANAIHIRIYVTLIVSMLAGRCMWGISSFMLHTILQTRFTWHMFIAGALLNAIPGIILQLVCIPGIIYIINRLTPTLQ